MTTTAHTGSHRFQPRHLANSEDEEIGYRRGFDQGVAAFAYALGIDNVTLQRLAFKRRSTDFRHGRLAEAPSIATPAEKAELRQLQIKTWRGSM